MKYTNQMFAISNVNVRTHSKALTLVLSLIVLGLLEAEFVYTRRRDRTL